MPRAFLVALLLLAAPRPGHAGPDPFPKAGVHFFPLTRYVWTSRLEGPRHRIRLKRIEGEATRVAWQVDYAIGNEVQPQVSRSGVFEFGAPDGCERVSLFYEGRASFVELSETYDPKLLLREGPTASGFVEAPLPPTPEEVRARCEDQVATCRQLAGPLLETLAVPERPPWALRALYLLERRGCSPAYLWGTGVCARKTISASERYTRVLAEIESARCDVGLVAYSSGGVVLQAISRDGAVLGRTRILDPFSTTLAAAVLFTPVSAPADLLAMTGQLLYTALLWIALGAS